MSDTEIQNALRSPSSAYDYAFNILKGRFELGEKVISKDSMYSYHYAFNILKGRFELGEKAISKDSMYSYHYALNILKGRFELGEKAISKGGMYYCVLYSFLYEQNILHCTFEELELKGIKKRPNVVNVIMELEV